MEILRKREARPATNYQSSFIIIDTIINTNIINKCKVPYKHHEEYEELLEKLQRELDEFYISKGLL